MGRATGSSPLAPIIAVTPMPLSPGTRMGPGEIKGAIAAGGVR